MTSRLTTNHFIIYLVLIASTVGCTTMLTTGSGFTVPLADPLDDFAAKKFQPSQQKSNVYAVRCRSGGAIYSPVVVVLDDEIKQTLASQTYFLFEVEPGEHIVAVITTREDEGPIQFEAEAGGNYYFKVKPELSFPMGKPIHRIERVVDEAKGRKMFGRSCRLAQPVGGILPGSIPTD